MVWGVLSDVFRKGIHFVYRVVVTFVVFLKEAYIAMNRKLHRGPHTGVSPNSSSSEFFFTLRCHHGVNLRFCNSNRGVR